MESTDPIQGGRPGGRSTVFWLAVVALLTAVLVQAGHLGSPDVEARHQVARSLWTAEPEVPERLAAVEWSIPGADGTRRCWYGIGQSLVILPFDIAFTSVVRVMASTRGMSEATESMVVRALVGMTMSASLCVAAVLLGRLWLWDLGFSRAGAAAGALGLLLGSTMLLYVQMPQENLQTLVLALVGFVGGGRWVRTGSRAWLAGASVALGLNLLARLTTVLDAAAVGGFVGLALWNAERRTGRWWARATEGACLAGTTLACFVLIDRVYQHHRFGSWTSTYIGIWAESYRAGNPALPASFPFSHPMAEGLWGHLFAPETSVFLVDPLCAYTLVLAVVAWRRWPREIGWFALAGAGLLLGQVLFHARYELWRGVTWGARYVTVPVHLLALLAVPMGLEVLGRAGRMARVLGGVGVSYAVLSQALSVILPQTLEPAQFHRSAHSTRWLALQRTLNLVEIARGRADALASRVGVPASQVTPNLLPFILIQKYPHLPRPLFWVGWGGLVLAWLAALVVLQRQLARDATPSAAETEGLRPRRLPAGVGP